jgi:hypothetical protein
MEFQMALASHNYFAVSIIALCMVFNSIHAAAETDMTKVTCNDFTEIMLSKDPQQEVAGALFVGFLWGLYKGEDEPLVIGNASDNKKLGKLASFCKANPNTNLITAADKTMDQ